MPYDSMSKLRGRYTTGTPVDKTIAELTEAVYNPATTQNTTARLRFGPPAFAPGNQTTILRYNPQQAMIAAMNDNPTEASRALGGSGEMHPKVKIASFLKDLASGIGAMMQGGGQREYAQQTVPSGVVPFGISSQLAKSVRDQQISQFEAEARAREAAARTELAKAQMEQEKAMGELARQKFEEIDKPTAEANITRDQVLTQGAQQRQQFDAELQPLVVENAKLEPLRTQANIDQTEQATATSAQILQNEKLKEPYIAEGEQLALDAKRAQISAAKAAASASAFGQWAENERLGMAKEQLTLAKEQAQTANLKETVGLFNDVREQDRKDRAAKLDEQIFELNKQKIMQETERAIDDNIVSIAKALSGGKTPKDATDEAMASTLQIAARKALDSAKVQAGDDEEKLRQYRALEDAYASTVSGNAITGNDALYTARIAGFGSVLTALTGSDKTVPEIRQKLMDKMSSSAGNVLLQQQLMNLSKKKEDLAMQQLKESDPNAQITVDTPDGPVVTTVGAYIKVLDAMAAKGTK